MILNVFSYDQLILFSLHNLTWDMVDLILPERTLCIKRAHHHFWTNQECLCLVSQWTIYEPFFIPNIRDDHQRKPRDERWPIVDLQSSKLFRQVLPPTFIDLYYRLHQRNDNKTWKWKDWLWKKAHKNKTCMMRREIVMTRKIKTIKAMI